MLFIKTTNIMEEGRREQTRLISKCFIIISVLISNLFGAQFKNKILFVIFLLLLLFVDVKRGFCKSLIDFCKQETLNNKKRLKLNSSN